MTLMSCDSVCCMCGEAWSSRWLMTWLTNGQHGCVLLFLPVVDILNVNLFSLYLINFMFHTTLDAVGNILTVNYKSMKRDVSFSQGSVSTLFRWDEDVIPVCVNNVPPAYSSAKIIKIKWVFPELWPQMYCHVFYESQCWYHKNSKYSCQASFWTMPKCQKCYYSSYFSQAVSQELLSIWHNE